jgi:hypothetical protein
LQPVEFLLYSSLGISLSMRFSVFQGAPGGDRNYAYQGCRRPKGRSKLKA